MGSGWPTNLISKCAQILDCMDAALQWKSYIRINFAHTTYFCLKVFKGKILIRSKVPFPPSDGQVKNFTIFRESRQKGGGVDLLHEKNAGFCPYMSFLEKNADIGKLPLKIFFYNNKWVFLRIFVINIDFISLICVR